jgi:glutamine cyclotransferase
MPIVVGSSTPAPSTVPTLRYRVVTSYPHDRGAWTEGLTYVDGVLYESTGPDNGGAQGGGPSSLRRVNLETGAVEQRQDLPLQYYGEGVAVFGDTIAQLTWQNQVGFVYDRATFTMTAKFSYAGEGWGLTYDGTHLIMSNGTSTLHLLDPQTRIETGTLAVSRPDGQPVGRLNELEYVNGAIFANVWPTNQIVRIDATTGLVTGQFEAGDLLSAEDKAQPTDVPNGIAYDQATGHLLLTGKLWPKLFVIELAE